MKALSIRQPWAWAILHADGAHGPKDVENRTWRTTFRGPVLIHAGKRQDGEGWATLEGLALELPLYVETGGIIGVVDLIDCVQDHPSPWAMAEHWHWVLANPRPLPFQAVKGQLGIFTVTLDRQLAATA